MDNPSSLAGQQPHPFQSIVQVTLNTGKIRIAVQSESDAEEIAIIAAALGAKIIPGVAIDGLLTVRIGTGSARIALDEGADGIRTYCAAVLAWDPERAPAIWESVLDRAALRSPSLPRRSRPTQLPWLAAFVTPEGRAQPPAFVVRMGEVTRAAAWAVLARTTLGGNGGTTGAGCK